MFTPSRRRFLHSLAALAVPAAVLADKPERLNAPKAEPKADVGDGPAKKPDDIVIIDTHQHLWDLRKFNLPWVEKKSFLDRNYLPADYAAAVEGLNVEKAVYLEVDVAANQKLKEAEHVIGLCLDGDTHTAGAVIGGRPDLPTFGDYARLFKGSKYVKGVRRVLHGGDTPAGHPLKDTFVENIRLLGELGLHFELCMRHEDIPVATKLVDACKDTTFVLDHLGNPDLKKHEKWKKDIAELATRKNVAAVKVSGVVASAEKGWKPADLAPVVTHGMKVFGPDRVMFGSDWPVCLKAATIAQWVAALKEIVAPLPAEEKRKLFRENAVRVYRLG